MKNGSRLQERFRGPENGFGIVDMLEIPHQKVVDTLRSSDANMQCIFFTSFGNSALCQKQRGQGRCLI
jgi:hypothetical protein